MVVREDFTLTLMSSFCPKIKPSFLVWVVFVLPVLFMSLSGQTVRWGTHKGPASPLHTTFPSANWAANPTNTELAKTKLLDILGNDLANSTGGPDSSWSRGDRVELGFFASSFGGDGNPGGGDDTASSNMFEGVWVPLTIESYIGQDWGDGTPTNETVVAGEFAFDTDFTKIGDTWQDYAEHNVQGDSAFRIQNGDGDEQTILPALLGDMDSNTKLGIRFYDSTGKTNETTRYNTIMNNNWTWDPNGVTEMYLHDSSSPHAVDTNLVFEFDNSDYASVSRTGSAGVNAQSSDYVTTITYWTGLSGLDISGSNENTVLSGVGSSQNITGGGNNELTLNVNGAGTTSNAYSYSGDIVDTGASGYLEVIKTGSGKQTITGNLNMVSDTGSVLHVNDGTLTLNTASGKTHSVEYLKGAGGTLELADGDSDLITLGFANTNGGDAVGSNSFDYSDATFAGTVLMSGNVAHTIKVGSGTTAGYYEDEQTLSGSLSTSGTDTLVKDGVGRLRLTGDSSSNYDNLITVNHGTLVLGDGSDAGADFHSSTSFRVEKGKLEIAAGESITNTVQGSASSSSNKSMVGGKGTLDTVTIGTGNNEVDTISPGQGIASSLTATNSQVQASIGNGAASDSIGTFTVTNLTLNNDAVFDWEITDFDGTAGSDWDLLAYDNLVFGNDAQIDINLFSLLSNGNAGSTAGDTFAAKATTSGFKILDGSGSGSINWGNYGGSGARQVDSLFNINQQGWAHYNHGFGSWGVYYDGGHDFYLTYSAVPEPSTYMMVTGLLMLPGYNFVRRFRKKKLDKLSEEEEGNLS